MKLDIENGKYTFIQRPDGGCEALRYGEPWRDLVGDSLVLCMAQEIERLREKIDELDRIAWEESMGDDV